MIKINRLLKMFFILSGIGFTCSVFIWQSWEAACIALAGLLIASLGLFIAQKES
ncbi:MAG: hypothetical protein WC455_15820 [Dehalococcoidia bacterium]|jgi:hypothetical protein